jgi:anti-sigma B factor antagonist
MNVKSKLDKNGQCHLSIEGDMTIYRAMELKAELLAPLEDCQEMEIDLSCVGEIDTVGLQVLVVLKREADALGKALRFIGHSQAVLELMDLCDLGSFFGDPVLISVKA